jgi:hypothetical protein
MGSPLGPLFANFYMTNLENNILEESNYKPLIYCRYVDDIFVVVDHEDQLLQIKNEFEKNSVLEFTYEIEKQNKFVFLDVVIQKVNGKLVTSVHTKETNDGTCLNYNSICPL